MEKVSLSNCVCSQDNYEIFRALLSGLNMVIEKINEQESKIAELENDINMLTDNQLEISKVLYQISKIAS